ncbi:MAG: polysaccharide biosynthesis tyrosine autokinase [Phenylobacterium sp.]
MNLQTPPLSQFAAEAPRPGAESWLPQAAANALDFRRWFFAFRRRLRLFAAIGLTVFVAAVLSTLQATPMYTATASVVLDTQKERVSNVQQVLSDLPASTEVVDTEVEVLRSGQLAERVVSALKLDDDPEFNGSLRKPTGVQAVVAAIKGLFGAAAPAPVRLSDIAKQKRHEGVVENVRGRLSVQRVGLTFVIRTSFTSDSPPKAATIANKFAELYLLEQLEAKFEATEQATRWLNGQLEKLRGQVQSDEAAVQQYKIENNLLSASGTSLTEQEISVYNQNLAGARAQLAEDEARLTTARSQLARGSNGGDVGEAMASPVVQGLRSQRAAITARVADLQGRYGERHPAILTAQRQLSEIDVQIEQEIQRILSNLEAKVQVSRERVNSMGGSLGGAKGLLAANNRSMVRLHELERNAEASKTLYESYLNRYKETSSQGTIGQSDARVVSKARIPTGQSSPNVSRNMMLGLILALAAGAAAVIFIEILDAGLATAEDVERRLDTAYLGSVPLLSSVAGATDAPIDYVVDKPLSGFAEAFRSLQASIFHARPGEPVKVVAITSALPGEGKTTTAICLARSAALQGRRTVVVDCDLRRRTVNRMMPEEPKVGLLEVLNGEATLEQALSLDAASGASILPLARTWFTPRDVFGSAAMDRLLVDLRARYDLVILDTAPILPVADTRVLASKADLLVLLARWRKTPQPAIEAAFRLLRGSGVNIGGVVLTQVDMKMQSKYGYGDPGYYYAEYKKYYVS